MNTHTETSTCYTDPRHAEAAKPLRALTITTWVAADSTATTQDIVDALAVLGVHVETTRLGL